MAKEYNVGDRLYLPVTVKEIDKDYKYSVAVEYVDCEGRDTTDTVCIADEPDLLLTAEEVARDVNTERDDALAELKSRNAEALLKEVMATRDEAIKQNNELIADRNNWKEAAQRYHDSAKVADAAADNLRKDNMELKAKVTELSVENDKLTVKAEENADTISRLSANKVALTEEVGRLRETIADRTKDVQHLTEEGTNLKADYDELKGRYEELDSVNHEQAEKIRKLDKALSDIKKRNDDLQAENTNLTFLLEDAPEKEATKTLHVTLNDGTEIEFRRYTDYQYRTDVDMFVVKDGEKHIAGFMRGDKPTNIAYWWTE